MFSVDTISGLLYYIRVVKRNDARASGSAVEHHLAKVGVAGSIPVSRSREGSGSPAEAVRGFSLCAEPRGKRLPAEAVRGFSLCAEPRGKRSPAEAVRGFSLCAEPSRRFRFWPIRVSISHVPAFPAFMIRARQSAAPGVSVLYGRLRALYLFPEVIVHLVRILAQIAVGFQSAAFREVGEEERIVPGFLIHQVHRRGVGR